MAAMRTISPSEFVRRLKHSVVSHDSKIVWFLGAGCSVSSGVEDAGALTQRWLRELKYLETGDEDELEQWAEARFPAYDRDDPAAAYIQVHEALFYTDQDQQREQEALALDGQPGFGYATLAQLLTHERWGERCNTVITTNFDDLAADALYFYSQRKPQVLTHESFDRHVQVSDARPTIVKLYGDAHLSSEYLDGNRRLLRTDVKNRLRALATECTLVFVGYGGRDDCILDLFEEMPLGAPSGGVFWVNDKAPGKSMAGWLEDRRAIWAQNDSFDDLMYLLRREFELGHPRIDRFDQILQKYDEQYRALADEKPRYPTTSETEEAAAVKPVAEPAAVAEPTPVAAQPVVPVDEPTPAPKSEPEPVSRVYAEATADAVAYPVATEPKPEMQPSPAEPAREQAVAKAVEPLAEPASAVVEAAEVLEPATPESLAGEPLVAAAIAMKALAKVEKENQASPAARIDAPAAAPAPIVGAVNGVETTLNQINGFSSDLAAKPDSANVADLSSSLNDESVSDDVLELNEEAHEAEAPSRHKIDALVAAAVKAMATDSEKQPEIPAIDMSASLSVTEDIRVPLTGVDIEPDDVAPPLDSIVPQPLAEGPRAAPKRAPDAELIDIVDGPAAEGPPTPPNRLMRRDDAVVLDARFRSALTENPRDAMLLANYAQFLTVGRQDHDGAEHYFNRAIDADPQNDAALRLFATFLTEIRRDHERAEDCYRLAIRANFESAETMCSYAEFLWHARGDFETAGECFQVAVDAAPRDALALTRYAMFLRSVQRNDDAAFALLKLAAASGGTDPAPTVALAEFTAARRNDIEKAESIFNSALEVAPKSVRALTSAAEFHAVFKGDLTRAEALFDQALEADPASTDALLAYGRYLHTKRGDQTRAEAMFKRAIELDPGSAEITAEYARFRDEVLVDDEGAEDTFRKAINLDPRDATVLTHYGRFLQFSRRKPNAAEDRLRKAVSMEPRNAFALRSYGSFLILERKSKEEGERYLRRAVSAAPSDGEALGDLAEFLSKNPAKREEAEEMFRRALAADQSNKRTLRRYARFVGEAKGDTDAAEELYRQVLDDQPRDARALGGSAHAMLVQGRLQEGLELLEKAFDAAMGDEPRRRSIDLLLELWFYRYAFDSLAKGDAIKAVIWLLKEGAKVTRTDLSPIVARAISDDHPEPDILRELERVVSGSVAAERLERFNVA